MGRLSRKLHSRYPCRLLVTGQSLSFGDGSEVTLLKGQKVGVGLGVNGQFVTGHGWLDGARVVLRRGNATLQFVAGDTRGIRVRTFPTSASHQGHHLNQVLT
jgi:hypothetical protein